MWLNCLLDDHHFSYITKNEKKTLFLRLMKRGT
jgi:hypothetical protein